MFKINSEEELLDIKVRKKFIEYINSPQEMDRKEKAYVKYMLLKDQVAELVFEKLSNLYTEHTLRKIKYAISSISINKKIIDKLARVYSKGAKRSIVDNKEQTDKLENLAKELDFNTEIKKINKYLRQQKNVAAYIMPIIDVEKDGSESGYVKLVPLHPFQYSVAAKKNNPNKACAFVLSPYEKGDNKVRFSLQDPPPHGNKIGERYAVSETRGTKDFSVNQSYSPPGSGKKQEDENVEDQYVDNKTYTFWSDSYHFKTDSQGKILGDNDLPIEGAIEEDVIKNQIKENTIVDFNSDQDIDYWSCGGDDLVRTSILVNCMLTNLNHISTVQGYGKFFMTGKNLPESIPTAPDLAIKMEHDEDDPKPTIGYANPTPNLQQFRENIIMQISLLLSTNNLSTSNIKVDLNSSSFPSGVSKLIDMAESIEDVEDQRQIFLDNEPLIWRKINKWLQYFNEENILSENYKELVLEESSLDDFFLEFPQAAPPQTEEEMLRNIKTRKQLGINTAVELIQKDRGVDIEQAEQILESILQEKAEAMNNALVNSINSNQENENDEENDDDEETEE